MNITEFKKEFDPHLNKFIDLKIKEISDDNDLNFLAKEFIYLKEFIKDGKRIRPYCAYLSFLSYSKKENKSLIKILVFLEIFHYFCLVHDDIMDKSDLRHGIPTVNKEFGNSSAILIGDYLFSWAWEVISLSKIKFETKLQIYNIFSDMTSEVFLGQAIDIELDQKKYANDDLILKKTLFKTAGYTFIKPFLIGLSLSGNYDKKNISLLESIGENLGLAFQIQDDLLDITSDFNGTKQPLSDISSGKHTIFSNYIFKIGTQNQKDILKKYFGKKIDNIENLRNIFYESGAISYGEKLINDYYTNAKNLSINNKYFPDFIDTLVNRKF